MTPIGSIIYWPSQLIPNGYLLCDGREVAINDYPELYATIGNIGGDDAASGNFRLPDMRGVVAGGYNSELSNSNPLHGNFGDQVGSATHTHTQGATGSTILTVDQIPAHTHKTGTTVKSGVTDGDNANYLNKGGNAIVSSSTGGGKGHTHTNPSTNSSSSVQPTKLYNWVIKAKYITQLGGAVSNDFEIKGNLIVNTINGQKTYLNVSLNTEIATNEYVGGKRVYIKQFEFTNTLTGGTAFNKPHGITNASRIWIDTANSYFYNANASRTVPIPCTNYNGNFNDRVGIMISGGNIVLYNDSGWGETWTKVIRLKYIK